MEYKKTPKALKVLGKFVAPILVGAILLGGCKKTPESFMSSKEYSIRVETYRHDYSSNIAAAHLSFSNACIDGKIVVDEQKNILKRMKPAYEAYCNYEKLYQKNGAEEELNRPRFNCFESNLCALLDKNINGFDSGQPELEKYLKANGYKVSVEAYESDAEKAAAEVAETGTEILLDALSD